LAVARRQVLSSTVRAEREAVVGRAEFEKAVQRLEMAVKSSKHDVETASTRLREEIERKASNHRLDISLERVSTVRH
jgi:hypothetical protein